MLEPSTDGNRALWNPATGLEWSRTPLLFAPKSGAFLSRSDPRLPTRRFRIITQRFGLRRDGGPPGAPVVGTFGIGAGFVAKAVFNLSTTRLLIEMLSVD